MAVVKNLMVRAGADFSDLTKATNQAQKTMSGFQQGISGTMNKIRNILITVGIGKLLKDSISKAMDVTESENLFEVSMGNMAGAARAWSDDLQKSLGLNAYEVRKNVGLFYNMTTSMGLTSDKAYEVSTGLTKLAYDMSSFYNVPYEEMFQKLQSGLSGEVEPLKRIGVVVNDTTTKTYAYTHGIAAQGQQLTEQQKIMARYGAIMEQTKNSQGDLARTINSPANQLRLLTTQLQMIQINLGRAFMPIVQIVLPLLTAFASRLAYIIGIVAQFSQALFGKSVATQINSQAKATASQTNTVSGLGKAYKDVGKEAKKAQGSVAGFDEVNSLSDNSDSGASGDGTGGDGGLGSGVGGINPTPINFDTNAPDISAKVQAMANAVKAKVKEITDFIVANKAIIISVIAGIIAGLAAFQTLTFLSNLPEIIGGISTALGLLTTPIAIASIAIAALVAAFVYLYQTNEQFRNDINAIWSDIAKVFEDFWNNTLKPIGGYIINDFIVPIMQSFQANILPVLSDIFVGASLILKDIVNLVVSTINNIWNIVKPGLDLVKTIVNDVLQMIKDLWDKYGQDLISNIRGFIQGVQGTFQLLWDNVLNPIIQPFLEMLSWLWTQHISGLVQQIAEFVLKCVNAALEIYNGLIKPLIDAFVVEFGPAISACISFVIDVFGTFLAGVSDLVKNIIKILGGIIDFITGVFTGNWKKVWQGVVDIFGGIFFGIVDLIKIPLNLIIDCVNFLIRGLNTLHIDVPDWVTAITGISGQWGFHIPTIPKLAKGGITNGPTLALVGDNPGGKEVVSPLDKLQDMIGDAVSNAIIAAGQFNQDNNKQGDIILQIDGTTFARITNPYNTKETNRIGSPMITIG